MSHRNMLRNTGLCTVVASLAALASAMLLEPRTSALAQDKPEICTRICAGPDLTCSPPWIPTKLGQCWACCRFDDEKLPAPAPSCAPSVGTRIALKADTGRFYKRCRNCQKSRNDSYPDTVTAHGTAATGAAVFTVVDAGGGKVGLKADNGKYVARCNGCIDGAPPDMLTVHATAPSPITFEKQANGKCVLKADNGKYVGRCRGCTPGATVEDVVSIRETDPNKPYVQLEIVIVK
ncbi:fascin domain-containing protein [Sorangium sp. So ce341]|uniref:fascin domain-containing protein n=1 Tax=Sorangium sp. So ce341 TaxID=3133302 RepID=UPI003F62AF4D